ncbi:TPA: TolC family protein [Legionella pneumophila]|nr:TolC family protein [Legionella pneumophila]HAT8583784.1 TolC family protein [Legionella pneumophila]
MKKQSTSIWINCLIIALFLFSSVVMASSGLTLKQLTHIAIKNNKDLIAARYTVSLAKARLKQASLWSNPSINLTNNDDRLFNNEGEYTRSAGFTQAFPISGRIAQQKNVARIDIVKAITEIKEAERKLKANVANTFYAALITERRLQQLNYLLKLNQQLVDVTHNRYHVAEVSELDSNTASLEYQRVTQEKQLLASMRISQLAQLNQLLGRQATQSLVLSTILPGFNKLPTLNTLQQIALKNRPDRQAILLGIQRAGADLRLAKAERFADWTLGLAVQQDKIVVEDGPQQPADRTLGINLSVPLPLLNRNQGRIMEASATGTQALMALRAINLTIETEVASNYAQLQALQAALQQTQNTSIKLTRDNINLAQGAYKNGQLSLLNLVQVQRQQNDLQMIYLANWEKYLQAHVALCTALSAGKPLAFCDYLSESKELK